LYVYIYIYVGLDAREWEVEARDALYPGIYIYVYIYICINIYIYMLVWMLESGRWKLEMPYIQVKSKTTSR
jgi:hypothetical protein